MNQQVNLLSPIFRKQQTLLSGRLALVVVGLGIAVLGVVHGLTVWQVGSLAREQAQLEVRRDTATEQLNQLAEQMKGGGKSQHLVEERDRLRTELEHKKQSLAALSRSELGNTTGFSPQFIGLARQRLSGLWLTGIKLAGGGRQLELRGITLDEALLPLYLNLLGNEPVFRGTRFGHTQMQRVGGEAGSDDTGPLRFELHSMDANPAVLAPAEAVGGAPAPEGRS